MLLSWVQRDLLNGYLRDRGEPAFPGQDFATYIYVADVSRSRLAYKEETEASTTRPPPVEGALPEAHPEDPAGVPAGDETTLLAFPLSKYGCSSQELPY